MKAILVVLAVALAPAALAQKVGSASPADLPSLTELSVEAVEAHETAFQDWIDARAAATPYHYSITPLPPFTGYFAMSREGALESPRGVVWLEVSYSAPDHVSSIKGTYAYPVEVCDGVIEYAGVRSTALVYLGPVLTPGMAKLDAELAAPAQKLFKGWKPAAGVVYPRWATPPDADRMQNGYPSSARRKGIGGEVELSCLVEDDLGVKCGVVSEAPEGWGFGEATRRAFEHSGARAPPTTPDGSSTIGLCMTPKYDFVPPP